jgi:hypothetical protein
VVAGFSPDGKSVLYRSRARQPPELHASSHRAPGRRPARGAAAARGRPGIVLAGRQAPRLRPRSPVAARLEAVSRRADHADLDRESR